MFELFMKPCKLGAIGDPRKNQHGCRKGTVEKSHPELPRDRRHKAGFIVLLAFLDVKYAL